jgi:hypothetical protein
MFDSLCLDLDLLSNPKNSSHLVSGCFGDQNLATNGASLYAGGEVDVASYYAILRPFRRPDIAHHHLAGMDPDPHLDLG